MEGIFLKIVTVNYNKAIANAIINDKNWKNSHWGQEQGKNVYGLHFYSTLY